MFRRALLALTAVGLAATSASSGPSVEAPEARERPDDGFRWPGGARAAVCLTYDDGLDGHLDVAAPDLDAVGLRGTFYCSGQSDSLRRRLPEWRSLARRGHELGNHTLFHPCLRTRKGGEVFDWVSPWYDLAGYSVARMVDELRLANTLLAAVDDRSERTFAYTCSDAEVGGESFVDAIRPLFVAARNDAPLPESLRGVDLHFVPSWPVEGQTGEELIAYVEQAAEKGTLAVIMFHSVGGGYLNVSRQAHRELLHHLAQNGDRLWTDTFLNVMKHLKQERARLGWPESPLSPPAP